MRLTRVWAGVCLVGLMCALGVQAQRPEPVREGPERERPARPVAAEPEAPGEDGTGTTLGTAPELSVFSVMKFSGVLKDAAGQPRTGTTGITFALYSEQEGGAPLWLETQNLQADGQGRYSVLLGALQAEGLPRELFTSGEARWLGVEVQGEAEQPRILLVSVPYALKAAEAETLGGRTASEFVLTERLETELREQAETIVREEVKALTTTEEGGIQALTEGASTFTDNNATQVVQVTQQGGGVALRGDSTGSSALLGLTSHPTGRAIFGVALATGNTRAFGMLGRSDSQQGIGFQGTATATTGPTIGVQGFAFSPAGRAINAVETATSGATVGLRSEVRSSSGTAGLFLNTAGGKILSGRTTGNTEVFSVDGSGTGPLLTVKPSGLGFVPSSPGAGVLALGGPAVHGVSTSLGPAVVGEGVVGVLGTDTADPLSSMEIGVQGIARTQGGIGVWGESQHDNSTTIGVRGTARAIGVLGESSSTGGTAVLGLASATTGATVGVEGSSGSTSGTGVFGFAHAFSGSTTAVKGIARSAGGTAGVFDNQAGGKILSGQNKGTEVFSVDGNGNVTASTFSEPSSRRWKSNIRPLADALDKVRNLRGVAYERKADGKHDIGFIAEEVGEVVPEVVVWSQTGEAQSLNYGRLTALLVEVVKEQQAQIRELQAEIDSLRDRLSPSDLEQRD